MTEVIAPRDESDWEGYTRVLARSLGGDEELWRGWWGGAREHAIVRLAVEGNRVVGGATAFPVGQWFCGRVVPAAAVSAVCAAPERRGRGVAGALIRDLAEAAVGAGLLVAPLWSSRTTLYRRWGWELAGVAHRHTIALEALARLRGDGEAVLEPGVEIRGLQRAIAAGWNGPLERPGWWWPWRYGRDHPHPRERVGWVEAGRLSGFMSFERAPDEEAAYRLVVRELWTATPGALRGLAGYLGAHAGVAATLVLYPRVQPGLPDLALLLAPGAVAAHASDPWMLRLLDVPGALAARGWPDGARARLELEVADPWRAGPERMVLEVEGDEARLAPGGGGRVRLGVGALSAWYAGALAATRAARLGLAEGPAADLEAMDALSHDRPVWLPDAF